MTRARSALGWAIVLAAALGLGYTRAKPAHACSCVGPGGRWLGVVLPADDTTAAPNTRIWVWGGGDVELSDETGRRIALTRSTITGTIGEVSLAVFAPVEPLEPGRRYQISNSDEVTHFTVTDAADRAPPALPEVSDVRREASDDEHNSCGKWRSVTLGLQTEGVLLMREPETPARSSLEPDTLSGSVDDFAIDRGDGYFLYYGGACATWPSASDTLALQFGSVDLAGNFSGWSETQRFERPDFSDPWLSCATSTPRAHSGAAASTGACVLLATLVRRRRRRQSALCP